MLARSTLLILHTRAKIYILPDSQYRVEVKYKSINPTFLLKSTTSVYIVSRLKTHFLQKYSVKMQRFILLVLLNLSVTKAWLHSQDGSVDLATFDEVMDVCGQVYGDLGLCLSLQDIRNCEAMSGEWGQDYPQVSANPLTLEEFNQIDIDSDGFFCQKTDWMPFLEQVKAENSSDYDYYDYEAIP